MANPYIIPKDKNKSFVDLKKNSYQVEDHHVAKVGHFKELYYKGQEADARYVNVTGDTMTGALVLQSSLQVASIVNGGGLAAGDYAPVVSGVVNCDSTPTMTTAQYLRVGNVVTVSGRFTVNPTTTATLTSFDVTLPISSIMNFDFQLAGTAFCGSIAGQGAEVLGLADGESSALAKIRWISTDVTSQTWSYTYTYTVVTP